MPRKSSELTRWTTEPRPVYELEDLNGRLIEGQFYSEELTAVRVTKRTTYKKYKILDERDKESILQYLVRWKGYRKELDSWFPAARVRNISKMNGNPNRFYVTLFSSTSMKAYHDNSIDALMVQMAHEFDLRYDKWVVGFCEFSRPTPSLVTFKPVIIVGETNGLLYCKLISRSFCLTRRPGV